MRREIIYLLLYLGPIWILLGLLLLSLPAHSAECSDPSELDKDMKKAYYQLKEMEKKFPGMKVEIQCVEKPIKKGGE